MIKSKIYVLKDPRTQEVKYVGKTTNRLSVRLSAHVSRVKMSTKNINSKKDEWIKGLIQDGYEPIIEEVGSGSFEESGEKELYWIRHYQNAGVELLNTHTLLKSGIEMAKPKRTWGGRKKIDQSKRKVLVSFWPGSGLVDAIGGIGKAKEIAQKALEKEYAKIISQENV